MTLRMEKNHLEQLRQHGEEAYPYECCGVLVGVFVGKSGEPYERRVEAAVRCANAHAEPRDHYHINPEELIRIQRDARGAGYEIVGFYHSHPDCPNRWSSTDLAEAYWTGCSYVITQVEKGKAVHTSSFLLHVEEEAKCFSEETIEISSAI